ncbi:MAG: site-2 protease family protein [Microthrixaceae bacterium]
MKSHLTLGRLFGVPIGINLWVIVIAVVLAVSLAEVSLPSIAPGHPGSAYWFAGVVGVAGFMVSLVAHEVGHSWVAQRNHVKVREITLWLFGGVAKLEGEADDPGSEFRIALAGPAMSALCSLVCAAAGWATWRVDGSEVLVGLLVWLSGINAVLAVSNLIPAYPLDGGRILRAVIWRRLGRKIRATRLSALWGQILAVVMAVVALWVAFNVALWSGMWVLALSLFLFVAARAEWSGAAPAPELLEVTAADMSRQLPAPLGPTGTVSDAEAMLVEHPGAPFVPLSDRRNSVTSLVTWDAISRIPPAQRQVVPATSVAEPLVTLPRVDPDETMRGVVERLGAGQGWWALVIDGEGNVGALLSIDVDSLMEVVAG